MKLGRWRWWVRVACWARREMLNVGGLFTHKERGGAAEMETVFCFEFCSTSIDSLPHLSSFFARGLLVSISLACVVVVVIDCAKHLHLHHQVRLPRRERKRAPRKNGSRKREKTRGNSRAIQLIGRPETIHKMGLLHTCLFACRFSRKKYPLTHTLWQLRPHTSVAFPPSFPFAF